MAQVMSAHLSKPPPLEVLCEFPKPICDLLGRMLEKDRTHRPQTAAVLRKEIEECAAAIAGATEVIEREPIRTPIFDAAARRAADEKFDPGHLIGGRYEILADLGETNTGRSFHARDLQSSAEVRLLMLAPEMLENSSTYTQLEREVERAATVQHPNLLGVHGIETVQTASFISLEWTVGFSLLELLRARRELRAEEALGLLAQAASGVDHALASGLKQLDLALHQVFIHFDGDSISREEMRRRPLGTWPAFTVKLNPLGLTGEISKSQTWTGQQTIVGGAAPHDSSSGEGRPYLIQALATIVYELLGGTIAPRIFGASGAPRYTPLATLSEQGNKVLRSALDPAQSFPSALEFHAALNALPLEAKRHQSTSHLGLSPSASNAPDSSSAPASSTAHASTPSALPPLQNPPAAPPARQISRAVLIGTGAVVLSAAAYFFFKPPSETTSPPESEIVQEDPVQQIDEIPSVPVSKPPTSPIAGVPTPTSPTTDRQNLLKQAVSEADALEAKKDWPECLRAWLKIATQFPESDTAKVHLNAILETLRTRPDDVNEREFPLLRGAVTEAAELDILAAMMFLADTVRKSDPETAFNWYSAASERGQIAATRQLGLMLSNGAGGRERDLGKAFLCFQDASEKGDIAAKYLLGECYLRGKGVKRDEQRAVGYLREAADAGNLYAMDLLGTCYHQGLGVEKDFKKAFELFSRASDRGYAVATGDLGVLYMKGDGMPKADPRKAVELFLKGIAAGDGNCMYYYALCFETGMGVGANQLQAQTWYQKAAEAGNKLAIEWCRKKGVPVSGNR